MSMTREDELAPEQASLRAAWEVIEEARSAKITGELAITTASSKAMVYLESGVVYFAHAEGDDTLANRLVEAGAITAEQLRRGALRLNGVEHLGRLFERDATVERDAVELALELMTEQALTEVSSRDVLSSQTTMYRQHSSGVVRWFAAPIVVTTPEATVEQAPDEVATDAAPMPIPTLPAPTLLTPNRLAPRPPLTPLTSLKSFMPITSRQPVIQSEAAPSPTAISSEQDLAAMITDALPLTAPYPTDSSADDRAATPIPEDVAAAVRRAIDAIETAMHKPRSVTSATSLTSLTSLNSVNTVNTVSFGPMHVTSLGHPTPTPPPPPEPFMIMSLDAFGASLTEPMPVFAKPTGAMVHPILSFGELSSDGAVYPLPVLPPLAQRTPDASSDQRRGALRRLIAGIRRR